MTGYGRGESADGAVGLTVEIKTVNHRYSDITIKQPRMFLPLEDRMKRLIGTYLERGKVDVFVCLRPGAEAARPPRIERGRALAYDAALRDLAAELGVAYTPDPYRLLTLPDVIVPDAAEPDAETLWPVLEQALRRALEELSAMREREGAHIGADLAQKMEEVAALAEQVRLRSPLVLKDYRERLQARVAEFLAQTPLDPERMAQELAYMAEKCCIDEELVRLASHIGQFRSILAQAGSIGRRLDFLLQEMNREVNTIGSKANDLEISRLVVELKSALEKVREQVQNIE